MNCRCRGAIRAFMTLSAGYELSMQGRYPGVYHYGKPNDYFHTVSLSIGYKFHLGK